VTYGVQRIASFKLHGDTSLGMTSIDGWLAGDFSRRLGHGRHRRVMDSHSIVTDRLVTPSQFCGTQFVFILTQTLNPNPNPQTFLWLFRYFDRHGIIRDIVQNHLLQTIALFAMEPPVSLDGEDIRNEKVRIPMNAPGFLEVRAKSLDCRGSNNKFEIRLEFELT